MNIKRNQSGFTLVELLVVIAIIGILVSLLLPAVQQSREAVRRTHCANNLKQLALAFDMYEDSHEFYPPGRVGCDGINYGPCRSNPDFERIGASGFVGILPFMELGDLYDSMDHEVGIFPISGTWLPTNGEEIGVRPPVMVCPSDGISEKTVSVGGYPAAIGNYAMCMGSNGPTWGIDSKRVKVENTGMFVYKVRRRRSEVTDGLTNTIFVGEAIDGHTRESRNIWTNAGRHLSSLRNTDNPLNTPTGTGVTVDLYGYSTNGCFASRHIAGANFAFGDGHVQYIDENIDLQTYRAISTRQEGETVGPF